MGNVAEPVVTAEDDAETRLPSGFLAIAITLILLAAVIRFGSLVFSPSPPTDLAPLRESVSQWLLANWPLPLESDGSIVASSIDQQLLDLGVTRIEVQRFDPNALVIMRPGADGQPGVAGVDDNGDGLIDNRSELGATRSDDVCVVVGTADHASSEEPTLVLQRGGFVAADDSLRGDDDIRIRYRVTGHTNHDPWSFLLSP